MNEDLKYIIGADSSKYERAMDRVRRTSKTAGSVIKAGFAAAAVGVGAVTAALAVASREVLTFGDQIHKANLRLGVSTEALSQLKFAADLSGVSFQTLQNGLRYMERQLSAVAATGKGPAKDALDALGLSISDLRGLKPETQFEMISEQLSKVADSTDKAALAAKLYGARGVELVQMAASGGEGLRAMRQEADDLGLTLSQNGANAIANFNDAMTRSKARVTAAAQALVVGLGPALTETVDWLGRKLPSAVNWAVDALKLIPEMISWSIDKLIGFYDVLGKLPGSLGSPYRQAAEALRETNAELENFIDRTIYAAEVSESAGVFNAAGGNSDLAGLGAAPGFDQTATDTAKAKAAVDSSLGYVDLWQSQAEAIYEIKSNHAQALLDLDAEAAEAGKAIGDDLWLHKDRGARLAAERAVKYEKWSTEQKSKYNKQAVKNLGNALQLAAQQNETAFKAYQVFQISEAVVTGISAAVKAWDAGMSTGGPYAPVVAAAYAAASLAWTGAQIAAISSASFGGGGSTSGNAVATYNADSATGVPQLDPAVSAEEPRATTNIYIDSMIEDTEYIDYLAEKLRDADTERDVNVVVG